MDKLRAILLMKADFNFGNKLLFGHRLMKQMKKNGDIPAEQHGSRNAHRSIEVALNRRLSSDISCQKRSDMMIAGVDAAFCYDRIVHSFAIMAARSKGMPYLPLYTMFKAIQSMEMQVRTSFGESRRTYGGILNPPLQGTCQGNGASPVLWTLVSSMLLNALKYKNTSSQVVSALSKEVLELIGFVYVDDTDLIYMGKNYDKSRSLLDKLMMLVEGWKKNLWISGGTLRPEKCYWYAVKYEWVKGEWSYNKDKWKDINILDMEGKNKTIEELHVEEAKEVVGVWLCPSGSN